MPLQAATREREVARGAAPRHLVESKEGELRSLQWRIEECKGEIGGKTRELTWVKEQVKRLCDEHQSEEKRLVLMCGELSDCVSLIGDMEEKLTSLRKSTEECLGNYSSKKRRWSCCNRKKACKRKKVGQLQISLDENARKKLESAGSSHEKLSGEIDLKRQDLSMVENMLEDSYKTMRTRENHLSSLEHSVEELDRAIALKQGELQSLKDEIKWPQLELQVKEEELGRCQEMRQRVY